MLCLILFVVCTKNLLGSAVFYSGWKLPPATRYNINFHITGPYTAKTCSKNKYSAPRFCVAVGDALSTINTVKAIWVCDVKKETPSLINARKTQGKRLPTTGRYICISCNYIIN
jgi:hypothetical protein